MNKDSNSYQAFSEEGDDPPSSFERQPASELSDPLVRGWIEFARRLAPLMARAILDQHAAAQSVPQETSGDARGDTPTG